MTTALTYSLQTNGGREDGHSGRTDSWHVLWGKPELDGILRDRGQETRWRSEIWTQGCLFRGHRVLVCKRLCRKCKHLPSDLILMHLLASLLSLQLNRFEPGFSISHRNLPPVPPDSRTFWLCALYPSLPFRILSNHEFLTSLKSLLKWVYMLH